MASTAGAKAAGKRSWQRAERQTFDERSHQVWRAIISLLALALVCAGGYYIWLSLQPQPKTLLLSITDDRTEYATVPPVPMLKGDEQALLGWAREAKVPTLLSKLSVVKDIGPFIDSLSSAAPTRPRFELLDSAPGTGGQDYPLKKKDTLIVYIRGHGLATLPPGATNPQPILVTRFERLQEITERNSISVATLLERLAAIPDVNKLVILDAVHFNYDPRLGQLVNQFPTAVAAAIPADAQNLWVLLPTASGEQTAIVPQHERTLFNVALVDALKAENHEGAAKVPLADVLRDIGARYHQFRNTDADLDFWQTLTLLPALEDKEVADRFQSAASAMKIPTSPAPPPPKEGEEKPGSSETIEQKKTVRAPLKWPAGGLRPSALALFQQPAPPNGEPTPAAPTAPASSSPTTTVPAPSTAVPPPAAGTPGTNAPPVPPVAQPTEKPAATTAPPADSESGPKYAPDVQSYRLKIAEAWRLRDELERWNNPDSVHETNASGWSPIHFAPHQWRRLNAHLISHEERCRAGAIGNSEKDLSDLILYLQSLQTNLQDDLPGSPWDRDLAYDLAGAWHRFRAGDNKLPSAAWRSFQTSDTNELNAANDALKTYADCAYRLPEYVHLQGLMLSVAGEQLNLDAEVETLVDRLKRVRSEFTQLPEDGRITRAIAGPLQKEVDNLSTARKTIDAKINRLAEKLIQAQPLASPGRAQAICLLLQSPLLRAPDRAALLDRVLPPLKSTPVNVNQTSDRVSGGSGALVFASLSDQVRREMKVIEFLSGANVARGSSPPGNELNNRANETLKKLQALIGPAANMKANALPIGAEFRQYLSQLPSQISAHQLTLKRKTDRELAREAFELYHWLLLVDGRDAGQLTQFPLFLTQPYLPQRVQDLVKLTLNPAILQLTDKPQEVEVNVELVTDKVDTEELQARLSLQYDANTLEVVDVEKESAIHTDRRIELPGKIWKGRFKITSRVTGELETTPLAAVVKFAEAPDARQQVSIRLPRPNLVDLIVVAEHRWQEAEPLAGAEIQRDQGAEVQLFPNRQTALKLVLRNLSSADKKVKVQLVRPPERLVERGRLYDEGGALHPRLKELETQILSLKDGLPPQIAGNVLAATNEKAPVALVAAGSQPQVVELELNPAKVGMASSLDATGGLICVITNVDNPGERFVKWLDLRPYAPDELYRVESFSAVDQDLSFQLRLLSPDLARGMRLDENPLQVIWDRDVKTLGMPSRMETELSPSTLVAKFRGPVPSTARRNVVVRLDVDGYPRAFLYQVQMLDEGKVIERNLKIDSVLGVHIARLAFEKQIFHIERPGGVFQSVLEPPPVPPAEEVVPQPLTRAVTHPFAGIRLDNRQPRQALTYDLQADVASGAFSNGAEIEITCQEGQEPRRFYHDRDIRVSLVKAERGTLTVATTVDDFRNVPLQVDTPPGSDTHATLTAAVRGSVAQSSVDGLHGLPMIFDRLPPAIENAYLAAKTIESLVDDPKTARPVVVRLRVTDFAGVGVDRVRAWLLPSGITLEPKLDDAVEINGPPDGEFQIELPPPAGLQPGSHPFKVHLEPVDRVGRTGKKMVLDVTLKMNPRISLKPGKASTTYGKTANENAAAQKELQKQKNLLPPMPPAPGSGS